MSDEAKKTGRHRRRRPRLVPQSLEDIAFHEAGHAVVAWVTGRKIVRVSMLSNDRYARLLQRPRSNPKAGCVVTDLPPRGDSLGDPRYRLLAEREVLIALGGGVAVGRLRGRNWRNYVSQEDLDEVGDCMVHAGGSPRCESAYLDWLAARVSLHIEIYWSGVEALAAELLDRRAIRGAEVEAILRDVQGRNSPSRLPLLGLPDR